MASSDLRYGTNSKNTSKYMTDLLNEFVKMPRSSFNETRRKIQDVSLYAIHPIECWEMLPNSDAYLSYDIQMISKNPTIKRLLSSMKAELRVYRCNKNDLWEGHNNYITKGRSGQVVLTKPYVDLSLGSSDVTTSLPYNPMFSMNMAPCAFVAENTDSKKFSFEYNNGVQPVANLQSSGLTSIDTLSALKSSCIKMDALPFVMYNKICKKYMNDNLMQNNPHWFPENENHDLILPYSATGAVTTADYYNPTKAFVSGTSRVLADAVKDSNDEYQSYPWLNVLQYSQRKGDMFNTGSPFPDLIRGDVPTLSILSDSIGGSFNILNLFKNISPEQSPKAERLSFLVGLDKSADNAGLFYLRTPASLYNTNQSVYISNNVIDNTLLGDVSNSSTVFNQLGNNGVDTINKDISLKLNQDIQFSMAQWRYLATMTVMAERLGLTDGTYNSMIKALFGHNPHWHNHDVVYCGGSTQPIVFSEVVNTTESETAPLGDTAGRAVTASGTQRIHVHSDDFGYFMTVLVITPDEYYSQGVNKMFSRLNNSEEYFPILNNLSPDSTLNKELFVSGDDDVDNNVFNYQERFAYYKSRRNEVSGLMALPISKVGDIGAYLQNRIFSDTPNFNAEFNRGLLTDNEKAIFASTNQAEFCAVIGSNMTYVAPIPEDSRPSDMGISY